MTPKYILIEEPTVKDFTNKINELKEKGYQPTGDFKKQDDMFYQMMEHKDGYEMKA